MRCIALAVLLSSIGSLGSAAGPMGELDLTVLDATTQEPIPVRLRIQNARGQAPRIRNVPRLGNDFTFGNLLTFKLKMGKYLFTVDRGPHYHQRTGRLEVKRNGFDQKTLELPRFVDSHKEGWYSGDMLAVRDKRDLELLLDAEELDYLVVPTWAVGKTSRKLQASGVQRTVESVKSSYVDFSGGLFEAKGGRLLVTGLPEDFDVATLPQDSVSLARLVKQQGGYVHLLDANAWDLPLLIAEDLVGSVAILNDDLQLDGDSKPAHGRIVKDERFGGQHGAGRYSQEIYFHLLNCGLHVPPIAWSGSGDNQNPPGYNRVYVACGQSFSADSWRENLLEGKGIVSNGPVLRVRANGQLPGYSFKGQPGSNVKLRVSCNLGTRQKIEYLEIIKDGLVVESVRLDDWAKARGKLPPVEFTESGWLSIRAYAPGEDNYRVAISAPFYVDFGNAKVSQRSKEFFVDWVYERARTIKKSKLPPAEKKRQLREWKSALDFWQNLG